MTSPATTETLGGLAQAALRPAVSEITVAIASRAKAVRPPRRHEFSLVTLIMPEALDSASSSATGREVRFPRLAQCRLLAQGRLVAPAIRDVTPDELRPPCMARRRRLSSAETRCARR